MSWTSTEKHNMNDALEPVRQYVILQTSGGVNQYVVNELRPMQTFNPTDFAAWALANGVTIASP